MIFHATRTSAVSLKNSVFAWKHLNPKQFFRGCLKPRISKCFCSEDTRKSYLLDGTWRRQPVHDAKMSLLCKSEKEIPRTPFLLFRRGQVFKCLVKPERRNKCFCGFGNQSFRGPSGGLRELPRTSRRLPEVSGSLWECLVQNLFMFCWEVIKIYVQSRSVSWFGGGSNNAVFLFIDPWFWSKISLS